MLRVFLIFLLSCSVSMADVLPGWSGWNDNNTATVDHGLWQTFLNDYLRKDDFGQTYFAYAQVGSTKQRELERYIQSLEDTDPLTLNKNEQKAYWFNLYNATTVSIILKNYPVSSIRKIGGSFGGLIPSGPWKQKVVEINGQPLSLDDIEHAIVRPKFNDYRVHFALNCAAMGCPNLAQNAYTGANIEALLSEGTRSFVNHQRGVRFQGGTLIVSKIFDWYQTDFVASEGELTTFLAQFAEPKLRAQLKGYTGNIKYEYDWSLNEVRESQ